MLEDLRQRYAAVDVVPQFVRLYRQDDPNGRMFSYFHMRLNELFGFLNSKSTSNHHYNANESRELLYLAEQIQDARDVLRLHGSELLLGDC